jgi:hypothetical protein
MLPSCLVFNDGFKCDFAFGEAQDGLEVQFEDQDCVRGNSWRSRLALGCVENKSRGKSRRINQELRPGLPAPTYFAIKLGVQEFNLS